MRASDELGEDIPFAAVDRALQNARHEVTRATACWLNWARRAGQAIQDTDGPAACDIAWTQLRPVYVAVEQAKDALGDAHRQLTAPRCPGCAVPVISGARIYNTDGTPHTCSGPPAGHRPSHS